MKNTHLKPLVGVVADRKQIDGLERNIVMEKYLWALSAHANVTPFIIPSTSDINDIMTLLDKMQGLLLPGSPSNIDPVHYGDKDIIFDKATGDHTRDRNAFALIPEVLKRKMPLFGICRGMQEINVALGGTLFQEVHNEIGTRDHREDKEASFSVQYGPAHQIDIQPGGMLSKYWPHPYCRVNSLHGQAIRDLGKGLVVDAVADDGVIEAVTYGGPDQFALAVQWHPEVISDDMPLNQVLFKVFGQFCASYRP